MLILTGYGAVLFALLSGSGTPSTTDSYSAGIAVVIGAVAAVLLLWAFAERSERTQPEGHSGRARKLAGVLSGVLEFVVVAGGIATLAALFLYKVLSGRPFPSRWLWFFAEPAFVVGFVAMYLGAVLLIYGVVDRSRVPLLWKRSALAVAGLVFAVALAEGALRILSALSFPLVYPAAAHYEFHPPPDIIPGVTGTSVFSTNAIGLRGDEYEPDGRYKILTIGGSTTESIYLDDSEAWPYVLQTKLNQRRGPGAPPVWVGNAGRSGQRLLEHLQIFHAVVPKLDIDAVIVLVGINDVLSYLRDPVGYAEKAARPGDLAFPLAWTFYEPPMVDKAISRPFPQNLALWNLAHRVFSTLTTSRIHTEDPTAANYIERRRLYHTAPGVIEKLPNIEPGLRRYRQDLVSLVRMAREQGVRLVLATQPVIWNDSLSAEAEQLLWLGLYGNYEGIKGRYAVDVLAEGMARYNAVLRQVCTEYNVECVDLARAMNGNEAYYFDDAHFTELGAEKVAELFAEHLAPISRAPRGTALQTRTGT